MLSELNFLNKLKINIFSKMNKNINSSLIDPSMGAKEKW